MLGVLPGGAEGGIGWNVPLRVSNVQLELKAEGRANYMAEIVKRHSEAVRLFSRHPSRSA